MPNKAWIQNSLDNIPVNSERGQMIIAFWNHFYTYLCDKLNINPDEDIINNNPTKSSQYKEGVFQMLHDAKTRFPLTDDELQNLQIDIENYTMRFDEESVFKSVPNIVKILIRNDGENAKDYLKDKLTSTKDIELLSQFGQYTIEALIVHVLSIMFNTNINSSLIRVASLVDRLESSVRTQASLLKKNPSLYSMDTGELTPDIIKKSKLETKYPIGCRLVEFMEDRGLIYISNEISGSVRVKNKKGDYFLPGNLFVVCNFNISLLPIKLNLPMIYKPLDWKSACKPGQQPEYLSDLSGGYLSAPTGEIYDRYRLLTGDINHFYIHLSDNYKELCSVMNKLQCQPFKINSDWLEYLLLNNKLFVEYGYLMPKYLSSFNLNEVTNILREYYIHNDIKYFSYNELLHTLYKNIQRSRYEQLIIKLAIAYNGYNFYLPAFLDFRGRIYRCGVLHFHERDLARSLILFADRDTNDCIDHINEKSLTEIIIESIASHYKSFKTLSDGGSFLSKGDILGKIFDTNQLLEFSRNAKRPFQFIANAYALNRPNMLKDYPITQDASASAYQIMSYFLLDKTLAMKTNLLPSPEGQIEDIYSFFLEELKEWMIDKIDPNLFSIVSNLLTRKIVKGIFMPIIYGKTLMSTANDLASHFSHFITRKECFYVAKLCFQFWGERYKGMDCLIRLIRNIGWIVCAKDSPVIYNTPYFTTVQDYLVMKPINIWVYDKQRKRRRVTLRVATSNRNCRKTLISTFVNFIHQKDATIAMNVVNEMQKHVKCPIYTVHDNFITTIECSYMLPYLYTKIFAEMGSPLSIINEFIYINIIKPYEVNNTTKQFDNSVILDKRILHDYLYNNIPSKISKKKMQVWEERIGVILSSYEEYIQYICGQYDKKGDYDAHHHKWYEFRTLLLRQANSSNYSLHY